MQITTLGTSHGDATYCRFNLSTLYESGGACYLIDCGAPCEATHYNPESAVPLFAHSKIDRLILSHIGNYWHGSGEETLLAYYNSIPYPVVIAHDGDEFTL